MSHESNDADTNYDVSTQVTEIATPAVSGYSYVNITFGDNPVQVYPLEMVSYAQTPISEIPVRGSTLKVVTQLKGSSETETRYYFYDLISSGTFYQFFISSNSDGSDADRCGRVETTSPDPEKVTLKAVLTHGEGDPFIIIGDIVIDPPIEG